MQDINVDEQVRKQNDILLEISEIEQTSVTTLKDKIKRLKEVTIPLINAGYYPDKNVGHLCSIIRDKLKPYHIPSIEQRAGWFYGLFEDEERSKDSDILSQKISSLPIEKRTGLDDIDKLKEVMRNSEPLPDDYQYGLYFRKIVKISEETIKQAESLLRKLESAFYFIRKFDDMFPDKSNLETELRSTSGKKQKELTKLYDQYKVCGGIIHDIESGVGTTQDKITKLDELFAQQKFISKQIDERNKITFIEKWNIIIADIEIGISAIAKKLGINKKHVTNNIKPGNNPVTNDRNRHHDYIDWFTAIQVVSPKGEEFIFNAKNYFDEQIERGKLNIPFTPMVLRNCEV